jgi:hypothetical protein
MKKTNNELAFGMESVLADENYQNIFTKPKQASAKESIEVKLSADNASNTFSTLLALSDILDDMGFCKSAQQLLKAAEAMEEPEHKSEHEDNDLDDLLKELSVKEDTGDVSFVIDKPCEDDEKEGNPEKGRE